MVPHYFTQGKSKVEIRKSTTKDVMPMDVVVRVDVSPWADPSAFAVFAENFAENSDNESTFDLQSDEKPRSTTDV